MKILIVDDNRDDRQLLRYMVEKNGHEAIEATDGFDGIRMAKKSAPDLIISDALMPVMDGFQFLREVKQDPALRSIPFIFYSSSYTEYQDVRLAMSLGADAYVIKPVDPVELWGKIEGLLKAGKKEKAPPVQLIEEDAEYLKRYSEVVATKLEEKVRELERTLEDRKRAEELIKNILESVDEGFVIIDREYRILSANRAYAEKAGMTADEMIGKHCYELSHRFPKPCYESGEDCGVRRVFETGESASVIHTHHDKSGDRIYVETKAYPLSRDKSGTVLTAIEILIDITEKRKLEDQLRQAQKMEAVGTLAGGIAHDFNNILNVIVGYGTMALARQGDDPISREQINEMLVAADRAAHLTKMLLAFSRKQVVDRKPIRVNEIILGVEKMFSRIIGEDIVFTMELSGRDMAIMADSTQLAQVVMNLVSNARDAMPNGGHLTISTESLDVRAEYITAHGPVPTGTYALISVTDTGSGMDPETQSKIFEPFFTTKRVGEGTGLGLAIAYGIIKQHEGFIQVESEKGTGTSFKILLPIIEEDAANRQELAAVAPMQGGTETILVAEDDDSLRKLTRIVLESFGYTVITAEDGEETITKYRENRDTVRLLVLDMIMPKKNGKEAYDEIRKLSPDIKALFISGYTMDSITKRKLIDESMDFILKPVSPNDLLKRVREILDR